MFQLGIEFFLIATAISVKQCMELRAVVEMSKVCQFMQYDEFCKMHGEEHQIA